jgi:hypothetical protein
MSRTLVNFFLDCLLLALTLALVWSAILLRFVFPAATHAGGWRLWGMGYDAWADLQFALLGVFVFTVLLHLMLHWNWVCSVVVTRLLRRSGKLDDGAQTLFGVGTLIAFVLVTLGLLIAAVVTVRPPPHL